VDAIRAHHTRLVLTRDTIAQGVQGWRKHFGFGQANYSGGVNMSMLSGEWTGMVEWTMEWTME